MREFLGVLALLAVAVLITAAIAYTGGRNSVYSEQCQELGGEFVKADELGLVCIKGDDIIDRYTE